jgi:hypothetical protein
MGMNVNQNQQMTPDQFAMFQEQIEYATIAKIMNIPQSTARDYLKL